MFGMGTGVTPPPARVADLFADIPAWPYRRSQRPTGLAPADPYPARAASAASGRANPLIQTAPCR